MTKQLVAFLSFAAGIFFCAPVFVSYAAHGQTPQWVDESKDGKGSRCCGKRDCFPVESLEILEEGEGLVDVRINGKAGVVHKHAIVKVEIQCPGDDQRPFICLQEAVYIERKRHECLSTRPDETHDIFITPGCVRCIPLPQCMQNSS